MSATNTMMSARRLDRRPTTRIADSAPGREDRRDEGEERQRDPRHALRFRLACVEQLEEGDREKTDDQAGDDEERFHLTAVRNMLIASGVKETRIGTPIPAAQERRRQRTRP